MSGKKYLNLAKIFWLANNLQYCRLNARATSYGNINFKVKGNTGEGSLIEVLLAVNATLHEYDIAPETQTHIQNWTEDLNKYYVQAPNQAPLYGFFNPVNIKQGDSELLISDIERWRTEIASYLESNFYESCQIETAIIDKSKLISGIESFLEGDSLTIISDNAKNDLNDAIKCILFSLPTPAVMITFRASEDVLRLYYENKTQNNSGRKGWNDIIQELLKIEDANKPFVDYLNYIRTERNKAEHPGKTFTQSESETAFMQVIHLIEVISKDVK